MNWIASEEARLKILAQIFHMGKICNSTRFKTILFLVWKSSFKFGFTTEARVRIFLSPFPPPYTCETNLYYCSLLLWWMGTVLTLGTFELCTEMSHSVHLLPFCPSVYTALFSSSGNKKKKKILVEERKDYISGSSTSILFDGKKSLQFACISFDWILGHHDATMISASQLCKGM